MLKYLTLVISAVVLALGAQVGLAAPADSMKPQLVRTIKDVKLGTVLATGTRQAIYVWDKEPRGTITCKDACAKAWPPVIVKSGVVVPMHVKGIVGDFGTIRRPDGRRQLTFGKRALYTYAHEKAGQVLCNNVDSWFAVKVHA